MVLNVVSDDPTPAQIKAQRAALVAAAKARQQANANAQAAYNATLAGAKVVAQANLDTFFDLNFDLKAFIRAGQNTAVTAAGVGNFLATITNNYRSLRAQINAATTVVQVQAININSGWPSNP